MKTNFETSLHLGEVDTRNLDMRVESFLSEAGKAYNDELSFEEACEYAKSLLDISVRLERNPKYILWPMDNPSTMPSDCRVFYVYKPTYIAVAALISMAVKYPELPDKVENFNELMPFCLNGAAGRGFAGSGYERFRGMLETMEILTKAPVDEFLEKNPHMSEEFNECWANATSYLKKLDRTGRSKYVPDEWNGEPKDYSERVRKLVSCIR